MTTPQKPPMKLYWCEGDRGVGAFVVARSDAQAARYHERTPAAGGARAKASLVCEVPRGSSERLGPPSDDLLRACGGDLQPHAEGGRTVRIAGRSFVTSGGRAVRGLPSLG